MSTRNTLLALAFVAVFATAGCQDADDAALSVESDQAAAQAPGDDDVQDDVDTDTGLLLAASHIEGLERGLIASNEGLQAAVDKVAQAQAGVDRLEAMAGVDLDAIDAEAADAAGLDPDDYQALRDQLFDVLGAVEMREVMAAQFSGSDTDSLDPAARAELDANRERMLADLPDPFADMEPSLAQALRERQSTLSELRAQNIGLLLSFLNG